MLSSKERKKQKLIAQRKALSQQPKTSPYRSVPVTLQIGPQQISYYVPKDLLQNSDWISASSWGGHIHLPDVDESTGHVLVHYLHTGVYQTLHDMQISESEKANTEFKRAFLAYLAAKTYNLYGLQELAKEKIEHFGAELSIFDIVEAVRDEFSKLSVGIPWFHEYLEGKVKAAFQEDHTVFAREDFFGRIDNVALLQVLARCLVGLFDERLSSMLNAEREPVPGIFEENSPDRENAAIEAVSEEIPAKEAYATGGPEPIEEVYATAEAPPVEETYATKEAAPMEEAYAIEETAPVEEAYATAEAAPVEEVYATVEAEPAETGLAEEISAEAEPIPETKPEAETMDDPWGMSTIRKKKKKVRPKSFLD